MDSGCQYNYTVEFFPPNSSVLLSSDNRMLTEIELNQTQFVLSPSLLREGVENFEMGVVVNVTISSLEFVNDTTGQFMIDGGMLVCVRKILTMHGLCITMDCISFILYYFSNISFSCNYFYDYMCIFSSTQCTCTLVHIYTCILLSFYGKDALCIAVFRLMKY